MRDDAAMNDVAQDMSIISSCCVPYHSIVVKLDGLDGGHAALTVTLIAPVAQRQLAKHGKRPT